MFIKRVTSSQTWLSHSNLHIVMFNYDCYQVRWKELEKKFGTLHDFACHPCAGAMLIFSVSFQFYHTFGRRRTRLCIFLFLMYCYFSSFVCSTALLLQVLLGKVSIRETIIPSRSFIDTRPLCQNSWISNYFHYPNYGQYSTNSVHIQFHASRQESEMKLTKEGAVFSRLSQQRLLIEKSTSSHIEITSSSPN